MRGGGGANDVLSISTPNSWSFQIRAEPGAMDFERGRAYLALLVATLLSLCFDGGFATHVFGIGRLSAVSSM